jgi:hypothetical protein
MPTNPDEAGTLPLFPTSPASPTTAPEAPPAPSPRRGWRSGLGYELGDVVERPRARPGGCREDRS